MLMNKVCFNCKIGFSRNIPPSKKERVKFCSHKCQASYNFKKLDRSVFKNEKNGLWKGDKVGNKGLHMWVRRKLGKPSGCQGLSCKGISKKIDLSNMTGIYNREFKNWWYLCKSCHNIYDDIGTKVWLARYKKWGKNGGALKGYEAFAKRKRNRGKFIKQV